MEPRSGPVRPAGPAEPRWWPLALAGVTAATRASLLVSPRPAALALRRVFARNGRVWGAALAARSAGGVVSVLDEPYGPGPEEVLDVHAPAGLDTGDRRPVIVWTHGGAFVGGAKEEIAGYLHLLAAAGHVAVGVRYSRAPEATHPTPVRQVLVALAHLDGHAERHHIDADRFVVAGDSAGAHITAQVAAVLTNPAAAAALGLEPTIEPRRLRGAVLCCGVYDLAAFAAGSSYGALVDAVGWAYAGTRHYRRDGAFRGGGPVTDLVTGAFPPTFVTAGNGDPLAPQSVAFAGVLEERGVAVDALFYPPDHRPALEHEYQFHFETADAEVALARVLAFIARCTS
jgi:acetyl esterase